VQGVDARAADDVRDDGENDQTDDVVEHGRPEDHAPFSGLETAEIRQDARRDADGGGTERRSGNERRQMTEAEGERAAVA